MMNAIVYNKDGFWFVDYIDNNYELLPAVGIFKNKEDAEAAAQTWKNQESVASLGESTW
jgi:Uri superfamily endonuclease